jgi:hypothetical protein
MTLRGAQRQCVARHATLPPCFSQRRKKQAFTRHQLRCGCGKCGNCGKVYSSSPSRTQTVHRRVGPVTTQIVVAGRTVAVQHRRAAFAL